MRRHELKTWPEYFVEIAAGRKTFEIRNNDRAFKVGDLLVLREWNPVAEIYTDREERREVSYILEHHPTAGCAATYGLQPGYVILGLKALPEDWRRPDADNPAEVAAAYARSAVIDKIDCAGMRGARKQAEANHASMLTGIYALSATGLAALWKSVHEYVDGYEFRGDTDYKPTDDEQAMIEDAINGFLADQGYRDRAPSRRWPKVFNVKRALNTWNGEIAFAREPSDDELKAIEIHLRDDNRPAPTAAEFEGPTLIEEVAALRKIVAESGGLAPGLDERFTPAAPNYSPELEAACAGFVVKAVKNHHALFQALHDILQCDKDGGGLQDGVDNTRKHYQSQFLADVLVEARKALEAAQ